MLEILWHLRKGTKVFAEDADGQTLLHILEPMLHQQQI